MEEPNWLVVGLGNPGPEYEKTRHNVGFMVVDELARRWGVAVKRIECRALIGQTDRFKTRVELVKPQTFMNLSGESVKCLLNDESRSSERVVVIVDDLNIPFGSIRLRRKGSAGGHNGLRSIRDCLKTEQYSRLRIGIGADHPLENAKKFVLENFPKRDRDLLAEIVSQAGDTIETLLKDGIERAMSQHNC